MPTNNDPSIHYKTTCGQISKPSAVIPTQEDQAATSVSRQMRKVSQGKEVHADIRKQRDTGSYRNLPSRNVRVLSTHGDTVHAGM